MGEPSFATFHRPGPAGSEVLTLTRRAIEELEQILEREGAGSEVGLRIAVVGGGCSGLSYRMELDRKREHEYVQEFGSVRLFIDPKSAIYLKDTTLDYEGGLNGKGFVFRNPNARNTCGCGESFSV